MKVKVTGTTYTTGAFPDYDNELKKFQATGVNRSVYYLSNEGNKLYVGQTVEVIDQRRDVYNALLCKASDGKFLVITAWTEVKESMADQTLLLEAAKLFPPGTEYLNAAAITEGKSGKDYQHIVPQGGYPQWLAPGCMMVASGMGLVYYKGTWAKVIKTTSIPINDVLCQNCGKRHGSHSINSVKCPRPFGQGFSQECTFTPVEEHAHMFPASMRGPGPTAIVKPALPKKEKREVKCQCCGQIWGQHASTGDHCPEGGGRVLKSGGLGRWSVNTFIPEAGYESLFVRDNLKSLSSLTTTGSTAGPSALKNLSGLFGGMGSLVMGRQQFEGGFVGGGSIHPFEYERHHREMARRYELGFGCGVMDEGRYLATITPLHKTQEKKKGHIDDSVENIKSVNIPLAKPKKSIYF